MTRQITDCPGKLYPFVQGAFHSNIERWEKKVDKVHVPDYVYTSNTKDLDPASGPIEIIGEKRAVEETKAEIEELIREMGEKSYTPLVAPGVPKALHQFFLNNKAHMIHEVLKESGCTVYLPTAIVDKVLVYGPPESVSAGVVAVQQRVKGFQHTTLDICKNYSKDHARDLVRYFTHKKALNSAEREFQVQFTFPSGEALYSSAKTCPVTIVGKTTEGVNSAKERLITALKKYPADRVAAVEVEPLHHKHINGKDGKGYKRIVEKTSVELLLPDGNDEPWIALFYDGASNETDEIKDALDQAKDLVLESVQGQASIMTEVLTVPKEQHDKVRGENGTTLNALNPGSVLIYFGPPKATPGKSTPATNGDTDNSITLRGTPNSVEMAKKNITNFLEATKDEAHPKPIVHEFTYPARISGNLIGQKGANVNKLRDEYGVDVNLKEGKGEVKGLQVCVDAAWKKLQQQIKELEDRLVLPVKLPQKYHSVIIGTEGSTVKRLEEKYNVRITFPRSGKSDEDGETQSKQAPDEIIIRGNKKGVEEAKKDILELMEYEQENNHTANITVAAGSIGFMFRNASKDIKQLRDNNPTVRINIPQEDKNADPTIEKEIIIRGPKTEIGAVKKALSEIVKAAENTADRRITVDKKYHRALIGPGGMLSQSA